MSHDPYRVALPGDARCMAVADNGDLCEYRPHPGHRHSARTGSHLWIDSAAPTFRLLVEVPIPDRSTYDEIADVATATVYGDAFRIDDLVLAFDGDLRRAAPAMRPDFLRDVGRVSAARVVDDDGEPVARWTPTDGWDYEAEPRT